MIISRRIWSGNAEARLEPVHRASFEIMRRSGGRTAFAYDPHFCEFGYGLLGG